jgi:hypothetical protein
MRLFLALIFFSSAIMAQNDGTATKKKRNVSIGAIFFGGMCYRTLEALDKSNVYVPTIIDDRNDREIPKIGFTEGLSVVIDLTKSISLETGLIYSCLGYKSDLSGLTFGDVIDPRFGFVYQHTDFSYDAMIYNINYLSIPIKVKYTITGNRLQLLMSGGVLTNVFLDAQTLVKATIDGEEVTTYSDQNTNDYKATSFAGTFGIGGNYNISDHFRVSLIPTGQYSFTRLTHSDYIGENLWEAGLNLGLYYCL